MKLYGKSVRSFYVEINTTSVCIGVHTHEGKFNAVGSAEYGGGRKTKVTMPSGAEMSSGALEMGFN